MSFRNYSSKVKPLFIELPGFRFIHGAADSNNPDPLYIGREHIISRLKEILSNTSSKTGAYLVAGYRGMGKSSFVSKVIDELSFDKKPNLYLLGRFVLVYLFFLLLASFNSKLADNKIITTIYVIISLIYCGIFLRLRHLEAMEYPGIMTDKHIGDPKKTKRNYDYLRIVLWKPLVLHNITVIKDKYKNITQFLYILFLVSLIMHFRSFISLYYDSNYISKVSSSQEGFYWVSTCSIYALLFIKGLDYIWFIKSLPKAPKSDIISNSKKQKVYVKKKNWRDRISSIVVNFLNYNNHIYVHINVGYDNLKEKDILRLVAHNLKNNYLKYLASHRKNLIWKVTYFLLLLLLSSLLYFNTNLKNETEKLKNGTLYYTFFPTQKHIDYIVPLDTINSKSSYKNTLLRICNFVDINLYYTYKTIAYNINKYLLFNLNSNFESIPSRTSLADNIAPFRLIPYRLDYLFIIYFLLFWLLFRNLISLRLLNITTHRSIICDLENLNDRIMADIVLQKETKLNGSGSSFWTFSWAKSKSYPIADVREIETALIDILDKIETIPSFLFKPSVTFIFDELDKIEPQTDVMIGEKESGESTLNMHKYHAFTPEGARERQYAIQKLLSNLKHFLTKAKAKFIFIAGREMYDASLADGSDRNFFMGSIFHDVIYVDSFLTDPSDSKRSDVTSLIEQYVCKALLPEVYKRLPGEDNLNKYYHYLKSSEGIIFDPLQGEEQEETKFREEKIEKIIITLQHFIMYLTHVSNGSPKKLASFFEKYITTVSSRNSESAIMVRAYSDKTTAFLCFDSEIQYKIGLIHYLSSPITFKVLNTIKNFDDKLLYSASFLIDHLFKFHRHAFSYRNIENAPELIEINKTPELRSFITTIIQYLSQIHIHKLDSGLHDFRFNKRISHEISYLSKISEDASAAFNFTLDESQAIKLFYHRSLNRLLQKYNGMPNMSSHHSLVRSIANVHMILGDLHFYDDDYNEAIIEYQDAVHFIRDMKPKDLSLSMIVLLIRNLLKLGHSYEKRKTFDSAFLVFAELTNILIEYRNIDLSELGLEEFIGSDSRNYIANMKFNTGRNTNFYQNIKPDFNERPLKIIESDLLINELKDNLTPIKESVLNKISAFEGLRIIYQPLLAKLQITEKSHLSGISGTDIERLDSEFAFLQKAIAKKDKTIMASEFHNQVGNILFYKNGELGINSKEDSPFDVCETCNSDNLKKHDCPIACSACSFYHRSILEYLRYDADQNGENSIKPANIIEHLMKMRHDRSYNKIDVDSLKILAGSLSNLADIYFACSDKKQKISPDFFNNFLKIIESDLQDYGNEFLSTIEGSKIKIQAALVLCYLSSYFYKRADEHKKATWQYTKMLYLLNSFFNSHIDEILKFNVFDMKKKDSLEEKILSKIIKDTFGSYEHIHRTELDRDKAVFDKTGENEHISLYKLTIYTDLIEPLTIFNHIKLKYIMYRNKADSTKLNDKKQSSIPQKLTEPPHESINYLMKEYCSKAIASPYTSYQSIYDKILMLRYKATLNSEIFKQLTAPHNEFYKYRANLQELNIWFREMLNDQEHLNHVYDNQISKYIKQNNVDNENRGYIYLVHLVCDSIYCLHEIIGSMNTYGRSYILNSSLQAMVHEDLAEWSHFYRIMEWQNRGKTDKFGITVSEELTRLIGIENLIFINPGYQCEMAHNLYYSALETHSEGRSYRYMIDDMSFLDDDFNDNSYHFFAALERYKIATGSIKEQIKLLAAMYKGPAVYTPEYYNEIKM